MKILGAKSPDRGPSESLPSCGISFLETAPLPLSQARNEPPATSGSSISSTTTSHLSLEEEEEEDGNGPLKLCLLASVCDNTLFASSTGKFIFPKSSPVFEYRQAQHWKGSLVEVLCPRAACIHRLSMSPSLY